MSTRVRSAAERSVLLGGCVLLALGATTTPVSPAWAKAEITAQLRVPARSSGTFTKSQQKKWSKIKPPKLDPAERKTFRRRGRVSTSLRQIEGQEATPRPSGRMDFVFTAGHSGLKDRNDIDKLLANTERDSFKRELNRALLYSEHSPLRRPWPNVFHGKVGKLMVRLLSDAAMAPMVPMLVLGLPYLRDMLGVRHDTYKGFEFAGQVSKRRWEKQKKRIVDFVKEVRAEHVAELAEVGINDEMLQQAGRATGVKQRGPAAKLATTFCVGVGPDLDRAALAERWARRDYDQEGEIRSGRDKTHGVVFYEDVAAEVEHRVVDRSATLRASLGRAAEEGRLPPGLMMAIDDGQGNPLGHTLSQEAIEVLRGTRPDERVSSGAGGREAYHEALQTAFNSRFRGNISIQHVRDVHRYYTLTDVFEPGIYPDKPVETPWQLVRNQALVLDFGAQGARNGVHTRIAVARAEGVEDGKRADKAIELARKGEILATEEMNRVKAHLKKSIHEVIREDSMSRARAGRAGKLLDNALVHQAVGTWAGWTAEAQTRGGRLSFSGDDGVLLPRKPLTRAQVDRLMQKLAAYESQDPYTRFSPRSWRLIVSKATYANGERVATWDGTLQRTMGVGESEHKVVHKKMEGDLRLGFGKSDKIMLGFGLEPQNKGLADLEARIVSPVEGLVDDAAWDATRDSVEAGAAEKSEKPLGEAPGEKTSPELSLEVGSFEALDRAA